MKSAGGRPKNTVWHIEIENSDVVRARRDAALAPFLRNRSALITHLHDAYEKGDRSKPFDVEAAWRDMLLRAEFYFRFQDIAQTATPPRECHKRLTELANSAGRLRALGEKAMRDEVGENLLSAWCTEIGLTPILLRISEAGGDSGTPVIVIANRIKKLVDGLKILEKAARRAANDNRRRPGRPKGQSMLPDWCALAGLARVYKDHTGLRPTAGRKADFTKFAVRYLRGLGQNIKLTTLVEAIKVARRQFRTYAASNNISSPFD